MGQYYTPVILDKDKYEGKNLVILEHFLAHNAKVTNTRADGSTWAGITGLKLMEHSWMLNGFVGLVERTLVGTPKRLVWAGDYAASEEGTAENVSSLAEGKFSHLQYPETLDAKALERHPYLVNHSKMEYVDKREVPEGGCGWVIHPLPLLTCEGNGGGGGDFGGKTKGLVGAWARDLISVERLKLGKDYTKITFDLVY